MGYHAAENASLSEDAASRPSGTNSMRGGSPPRGGVTVSVADSTFGIADKRARMLSLRPSIRGVSSTS